VGQHAECVRLFIHAHRERCISAAGKQHVKKDSHATDIDGNRTAANKRIPWMLKTSRPPPGRVQTEILFVQHRRVCACACARVHAISSITKKAHDRRSQRKHVNCICERKLPLPPPHPPHLPGEQGTCTTSQLWETSSSSSSSSSSTPQAPFLPGAK
jgi:hypothetical protein